RQRGGERRQGEAVSDWYVILLPHESSLRFEFLFFPGAAVRARIAAVDPRPPAAGPGTKSKYPVVDDVVVVPGHGQRDLDREVVVVEPIPAVLAVERRDERAVAAGRPLVLDVAHEEIRTRFGRMAVEVGIDRAAVDVPRVERGLRGPEQQLDFGLRFRRDLDLERLGARRTGLVLMHGRIRQRDRLARSGNLG